MLFVYHKSLIYRDAQEWFNLGGTEIRFPHQCSGSLEQPVVRISTANFDDFYGNLQWIQPARDNAAAFWFCQRIAIPDGLERRFATYTARFDCVRIGRSVSGDSVTDVNNW